MSQLPPSSSMFHEKKLPLQLKDGKAKVSLHSHFSRPIKEDVTASVVVSVFTSLLLVVYCFLDNRIFLCSYRDISFCLRNTMLLLVKSS